jgi:hypothetical protein
MPDFLDLGAMPTLFLIFNHYFIAAQNAAAPEPERQKCAKSARHQRDTSATLARIQWEISGKWAGKIRLLLFLYNYFN